MSLLSLDDAAFVKLIKGALVLEGPRETPKLLDVMIEGETIALVGQDLTPSPQAEVIDAAGYLLTPGFINAHTHGRESLSKGLVDDRPLELWLLEAAVFSKNRSAEDQYLSVALGAIEMLKSGVTSAYDLFTNIPTLTSDSILGAMQAYEDVGIRALLAPSVSDIPYHRTIPGLESALPPDLWKKLDGLFPGGRIEATIQTVEEAFSIWLGGGHSARVQPAIAPVIPERCSAELLAACRRLRDEFGLPVHSHVAETRIQSLSRLYASGTTAVEYLHAAGLLGPSTTLAHAVWLEMSDLETLAETRCNVVHNPMSNMKIGSGVMPLIAMNEAGISVGLGTDGFQNMFETMRGAAFIHRLMDPDHRNWPSYQEILELVWTGGARSMSLQEPLGRIQSGYLADLILFDLRSEGFTPLNDAAAQLVLCETGAGVDSVMVGGEWMLRGGKCTHIDEAAIRSAALDRGAVLKEVDNDLRDVVKKVTPHVAHIRQIGTTAGTFNRVHGSTRVPRPQ